MEARDIMVWPVVTVAPSCSVQDAARILLQYHISGAPVIDDAGKIVGIITERDLLRRVESATERSRPSWLRYLVSDGDLASEYVRARARNVADVMTKAVISATVDMPIKDVAALLEKYSIKRVPVLAGGRLAGIISRANLVQVLATAQGKLEVELPDTVVRKQLMSHLKEEPWSDTWQLNFTVNGGIVDIWGICRSEAERDAIRVAAENTPGVRAVNNHLSTPQPFAATL
jgi:CBS domain-containing protein